MQAAFDKLLQTAQFEKGENLITESPVRKKLDDSRTVSRVIVADDGGEASGGLFRGKAPQVFEGGVGDRVGIGFHGPG